MYLFIVICSIACLYFSINCICFIDRLLYKSCIVITFPVLYDNSNIFMNIYVKQLNILGLLNSVCLHLAYYTVSHKKGSQTFLAITRGCVLGF